MRKLTLLCAVLLLFAAFPASAEEYGLFDWAFNINGTLYEHFGANVKPAHTGAFDWATGLGTLNIVVAGAGARSFAVFFDHEIAASTNAQFNEFGATHGAPGAGQTWEIDEPGWAAGYTPPGPIQGDIYGHVLSTPTTLEGLNSVFSAFPYDPSWALGWNFTTPSGKEAVVSLRVAETAPTSGFYLSQTDADNLTALYLSGGVTFRDSGVPQIPEPGSWALLATAVGIVAAVNRRRQRA